MEQERHCRRLLDFQRASRSAKELGLDEFFRHSPGTERQIIRICRGGRGRQFKPHLSVGLKRIAREIMKKAKRERNNEKNANAFT
jgi:hypothetical protein